MNQNIYNNLERSYRFFIEDLTKEIREVEESKFLNPLEKAPTLNRLANSLAQTKIAQEWLVTTFGPKPLKEKE